MTSPPELDILEGGGKVKWKLRLHPDALQFQPPDDGPGGQIPRAERAERLQLLGFAGAAKKILVVRLDKKRTFQLDEEATKALQAWIGPPTLADLKAALKRRLSWTIPIGIIYMLGAIPLSGDPERGMPDIPFDAISFGLGASLILMGVISRLAPSRIFFLLDAVWVAALIGRTVHAILTGESGYGWAVLIAFQLLYVSGSLREYARFAAEKMASEPP